MNITKKIAEELNVAEWRVKAAVELIDEGNTIPFIARYRKEKTGTLDDEQLRTLYERLVYLRNLEEKKQSVLSSIEEQGKLTAELKSQIEKAETQAVLDDIYRPYRPKRRTRATIAKEKGLEPLAKTIMAQNIDHPLEDEAKKYVDAKKEVSNIKEALEGAADIIAEEISDNADYRRGIRNYTHRTGLLTSKVKDEKADEKGVYETYYDFSSALSKISGYQVLAVNRGEAEKVLIVKIEVDPEQVYRYLESQVLEAHEAPLMPKEGRKTGKNVVYVNKYTTPVIRAAVRDAYNRLIAPAIEREVRNELTEKAEDGAIIVFKKNLEQLLMGRPLEGQVVMGWDPAFRTGCKLAVVDATGKVLDTAVIYPTAPTTPAKQAAAKAKMLELIRKYHVNVLSVGNGTASRESEQFIAEVLKEIPEQVYYFITNEAGASVYSASKLATEEFPNFDVGQRSAASIARRLQDPLAELVKIDPKSIGVGQYQHDMNQKKLGEALSGVVEDCVNKVGVDLNTASVSLLEYISGISKPVAKNIVAWRDENGRFNSRRDLLKVAKLGPKAYEQCAGFLRIRGGKEPLDSTGIHPESYDAARKFLQEMKEKPEDILNGPSVFHISDYAETAEELGIGEPTLRDIVKELEAPGRDPRDEKPLPILRSDVLKIEDLKEGMILKGTVRNIVDFGAFVDIGVHQDGLVHISQMSKKRIKHPLEVVKVGDVVQVKVLSVDVKKQRIGLSMKL
ncbi:MAG: Tex family protein [Eubacterium sp.]|nr:Tex family protein [Eubacterium sp.]